MTALSIALCFVACVCWDMFRRYLAGVDRTIGLKKLELAMAARLDAVERKQAEMARAVGHRAMAAAKSASVE